MVLLFKSKTELQFPSRTNFFSFDHHIKTFTMTTSNSTEGTKDAHLLNESVTLPCGAVSPNRLFKVCQLYYPFSFIRCSLSSLLSITGANGRNVGYFWRWEPKWIASQSLQEMGKRRLGNHHHGQVSIKDLSIVVSV